MSVSATIETRTRTNILAAPIASVTTRVIKSAALPDPAISKIDPPKTNAVALTNSSLAGSNTNSAKGDRNKPVDVIFVVQGDHVKAVPVKIGISDDNYWEITDGLKEGDEIVTGGFRAIGRDLDDGKKITKSPAGFTPNPAIPK